MAVAVHGCALAVGFGGGCGAFGRGDGQWGGAARAGAIRGLCQGVRRGAGGGVPGGPNGGLHSGRARLLGVGDTAGTQRLASGQCGCLAGGGRAIGSVCSRRVAVCRGAAVGRAQPGYFRPRGRGRRHCGLGRAAVGAVPAARAARGLRAAGGGRACSRACRKACRRSCNGTFGATRDAICMRACAYGAVGVDARAAVQARGRGCQCGDGRTAGHAVAGGIGAGFAAGFAAACCRLAGRCGNAGIPGGQQGAGVEGGGRRRGRRRRGGGSQQPGGGGVDHGAVTPAGSSQFDALGQAHRRRQFCGDRGLGRRATGRLRGRQVATFAAGQAGGRQVLGGGLRRGPRVPGCGAHVHHAGVAVGAAAAAGGRVGRHIAWAWACACGRARVGFTGLVQQLGEAIGRAVGRAVGVGAGIGVGRLRGAEGAVDRDNGRGGQGRGEHGGPFQWWLSGASAAALRCWPTRPRSAGRGCAWRAGRRRR